MMLGIAWFARVFLLISQCVVIDATPQPTPAPTPRPTFDECTSDYQCWYGEACKHGKCKATCASRFPTDAACGSGNRVNTEKRNWEQEHQATVGARATEDLCCQPLVTGDIFLAEPLRNCDGDDFLTTAIECEQAQIELEMRLGLKLSYEDFGIIETGYGLDTDWHLQGGCQIVLATETTGWISFNPDVHAQTSRPQWGNHRLVCKSAECTTDSDCPDEQHVCHSSHCQACHDFSKDTCPEQCQWETKSFPFDGKGECTEQCRFYNHASRCPPGRCHWASDEACEDSCATKVEQAQCEAAPVGNLCFWDGDECQDQVFVARNIPLGGADADAFVLLGSDCGFHMQTIVDDDACHDACFMLGQDMKWIDNTMEFAFMPHGCVVSASGTVCMFNPGDGLDDLPVGDTANDMWEKWDSQLEHPETYHADEGEIYDTYYFPVCAKKMCTCKHGRGAIGVEQGCGEHGAAVCHLCDLVQLGEHPYILDPVFHNCEKTEDWIVLMDNAICKSSTALAGSIGTNDVLDLKQCIDATMQNSLCNDVFVTTNIQKVGVSSHGRRRGSSSNSQCYCADSLACSPSGGDGEKQAFTHVILRHACHTFRTSDKCQASYCEWRTRGEPYTTGDHYHEGCFEAQARLCPQEFPNCWHTGDCVSEECSSGNSCDWVLNADYIHGNGGGRETSNNCNGDHQSCTTKNGASAFEFEIQGQKRGFRPHDAGHACRFPFMYRGEMYHSCTRAENFDGQGRMNRIFAKEQINDGNEYARPWCATGTDSRDWGFCDMDSSPTCSKTRSVACSTPNDCSPSASFCVGGLCKESSWVVEERQTLCYNAIVVSSDWRGRLTLNQCMKMVGAKAECGNFLVYGVGDVWGGKARNPTREDTREIFEDKRKDANRKGEQPLAVYGNYCGCVAYGESCQKIPLDRDRHSGYFFDSDQSAPDDDNDYFATTNFLEYTTLKQASCQDDSFSWFYKDKQQTCDWVASEPKDRCHVKGDLDGRRVYASKACPTTCGGCGQCLNDQYWELREEGENDIRGCKWVGRKRARCNRYGRDAFGHRVSAREACCKACSKFFDASRRLSTDVVV